MKNEIGNRYGKLVVVKFDHTNKSRNAYWLCACDCGFSTVVNGAFLRSGHTQSCGCTKNDFFGVKHGRADKEKLYGVWEQMRSRCNNPNNPRYASYGAKGISVCEEWNNYENFRKWAFANGYAESPTGTPRAEIISIDRLNPRSGYNPSNCQWITVAENSKKRKRFDCYANQR